MVIKRKKRIGILTAGGDCPGLNAAIRAVAKKALLEHDWEVIGIEDGYEGLMQNRHKNLAYDDVSGILTLGGTILGTSNTANPYRYLEEKNGKLRFRDRSQIAIKNFKQLDIDCLVCIGGDGTLSIAYKLYKEGIPIVGIPKTIDNDIMGTDISFGFDSAVAVATEAIDNIHTTAQSHHRIMIIEVMGRKAGWIALYAGIAGGGDIILRYRKVYSVYHCENCTLWLLPKAIFLRYRKVYSVYHCENRTLWLSPKAIFLIPEIPYDINVIGEKVKERNRRGKRFSIVVVAEGARPRGGSLVIQRLAKDGTEAVRLGGIGFALGKELEKASGIETRTVVIGHLQRGGSPTSFDRILATQLGAAAVDMIKDKKFGRMIGVKDNSFIHVPLKTAASGTRCVPLNHKLIRTACSVGVSFGN